MTWPRNQTYRNHVYYLFREKKRNKKKRSLEEGFVSLSVIVFSTVLIRKNEQLDDFLTCVSTKQNAFTVKDDSSFLICFLSTVFLFFRSSTRFDSFCSVSYSPRFDHPLCSFAALLVLKITFVMKFGIYISKK